MDTINDIRNVFFYESALGKFLIKFDYGINKWMLVIGDEIYGHYSNPIVAANDVYCQVTGCYEWDSYNIESIVEEIPTDIYCWNLISNNS